MTPPKFAICYLFGDFGSDVQKQKYVAKKKQCVQKKNSQHAFVLLSNKNTKPSNKNKFSLFLTPTFSRFRRMTS